MPIYEFYCEKCDCTVEKMQSFDSPVPGCPTEKGKADKECGLKRIISKSSFRLKGEGWYKDGYAKKDAKQ